MKINRDAIPFYFGITCMVLAALNRIFKFSWMSFTIIIGVIGLTLAYLFWPRNRK